MSIAYKQAGVDIDAGNALVERIAPLAKSTARPGVMGSLGGFGGLFDLKACGYKDPILVAGTDGVGTKLRIAIETGIHHTIGIDLVAMCVNDLVVQGAEPLFFLDYYATGALSVDVGTAIVTGIAEGCKQAGCALIGGETAEMPGMYAEGDYDLAGFAIGAVERDALLPRTDIAAGDTILGLGSSGVHSNGFSLVRHIGNACGIRWEDPAAFDPSKSYAEHLLTPTRIYVSACLEAIRTGAVKGLSHITGGGLTENLPRIFPETLAATITRRSWQRPPVFDWLQSEGAISEEDMHRTFNNGIGMALIVVPEDAEAVADILSKAGETVYTIGTITERGSGAAVRYE